MAKRALLVGCNYPGTNAELRGCINDVKTMQHLLTTYFGFTDQDITIMIDTDKSTTQPTGANMKAKLSQVVSELKAGDVFFFHFSGHGTQVPTSAEAGEQDGKDEAICPTDLNVICDDDLKAIFARLDPGCKFTMVADCCHSGTILDHDEVIISGAKAGGPAPPQIDMAALAGLFGLKDLDLSNQRDFRNRAIPFDQLSGMLSQMLGMKVDANNVRQAFTTLFGNDASSRAINAMQIGMQLLQSNPAAHKAAMGCMNMLLGCFGGAGAAAAAGGAAAGGQNTNAGSNSAAPAAPTGGHNGLTEPKLDVTIPDKVDVPDKMPDEVGILITGCQDRETSADACPSGDPTKAFGALTNGIRGVVEAHFAQNPGQPLTYRNLVLGVRDSLGKGGFAQNPCLECDKSYADTPFINQAF